MSFSPNEFLGPLSNGGFGLAALQRARSAGFGDDEIRAGVEASGMSFGERAAAALGIAGDDAAQASA